MRLLQRDISGGLSLTRDLADDQLPPYAILSHTWGSDEDEVNFQDLANGTYSGKAGYAKVQFCLDQAEKDGWEHCWVDSCCIDKSNHAELAEAIVSMFRWYRNAKDCYVYLSDVPTPEDDELRVFRASRWFTRGWTLQELLAPWIVTFFSSSGTRIGTKESLELEISAATGIPLKALRATSFNDFTATERFSWQHNRKTKKPEDLVYSLLGLFDVSMPILYGEGKDMARARLEEGIAKINKGPRFTDFTVTPTLNDVVQVQDFVGRDHALKAIDKALRSDGSRRVAVLYGLGGVGKTQLALRYAKQYRDNYSTVLWLNIDSDDTVRSSYVRIAKHIRSQPTGETLGLGDHETDADTIIDAVMRWLSLPQNTRWLMVFDNYDNPKEPGNVSPLQVDLQRYLPAADQGAVIVTTRSAGVRLGHCMQLNKFCLIRESLEVLSTTSNRQTLHEDEFAQLLAQELDGLPLALATAGAYLSRSTISPEKYLELYRSSWKKLQDKDLGLITYENRKLFNTWQVTFEQIKERDAASGNLLRLLTYFGNEDVWFELLRCFRGGDPEWLEHLTQDEIDFEAAIQNLCTYGLVELAGSADSASQSEWNGYSMHKCVHSWAKAMLEPIRDKALLAFAIRCIASRVPEADDRDMWILQRRLLNHAGFCWNEWKEARKDEHLEESWTYGKLARLHFDQGQLAEAEEICVHALQSYAGGGHESIEDTVLTLKRIRLVRQKLGQRGAKTDRIHSTQTKPEQALPVEAPDRVSPMAFSNIFMATNVSMSAADAKETSKNFASKSVNPPDPSSIMAHRTQTSHEPSTQHKRLKRLMPDDANNGNQKTFSDFADATQIRVAQSPPEKRSTQPESPAIDAYGANVSMKRRRADVMENNDYLRSMSQNLTRKTSPTRPAKRKRQRAFDSEHPAQARSSSKRTNYDETAARSNNYSRETGHQELSSVDDGSTKPVEDVDIPAGRQRRRRREFDRRRSRSTTRGQSRSRERHHPSETQYYGREKVIEDEDVYSYADPASMFRDTEPRWRETRPRRGSAERADQDRRSRRVFHDSVGPPPSTRGWEKIDEDLARPRDVREITRDSAMSHSREETRTYESTTQDRIPRRETTSDFRRGTAREEQFHDEPRASRRDRRSRLSRSRHRSVERRGFGMREDSPESRLPIVHLTQGVLKEPDLAKDDQKGLRDAVSSYARGDLNSLASTASDLFKKGRTAEEPFRANLSCETSHTDDIMWSSSKDAHFSSPGHSPARRGLDTIRTGLASAAVAGIFERVRSRSSARSSDTEMAGKDDCQAYDAADSEQPSIESAIDAESTRLLNSNTIWEQLQSHDEFQQSSADLDQLCSDLGAKARESEPVPNDDFMTFKDGGVSANNPSGAADSEFHSLYERKPRTSGVSNMRRGGRGRPITASTRAALHIKKNHQELQRSRNEPNRSRSPELLDQSYQRKSVDAGIPAKPVISQPSSTEALLGSPRLSVDKPAMAEYGVSFSSETHMPDSEAHHGNDGFNVVSQGNVAQGSDQPIELDPASYPREDYAYLGMQNRMDRSSSPAASQRDYILDLADPQQVAGSMDDRRSRKHPASFQCTFCPQQFTRAYNLRTHLRTHTDERPFVCKVCGKAFARRHDQKRHEAKHSDGTISIPDPDNAPSDRPPPLRFAGAMLRARPEPSQEVATPDILDGFDFDSFLASPSEDLGLDLASSDPPGHEASTTRQPAHSLQDFQMQLMLLERQNKMRTLMARQEGPAPTAPAGTQRPMEPPEISIDFSTANVGRPSETDRLPLTVGTLPSEVSRSRARSVAVPHPSMDPGAWTTLLERQQRQMQMRMAQQQSQPQNAVSQHQSATQSLQQAQFPAALQRPIQSHYQQMPQAQQSRSANPNSSADVDVALPPSHSAQHDRRVYQAQSINTPQKYWPLHYASMPEASAPPKGYVRQGSGRYNSVATPVESYRSPLVISDYSYEVPQPKELSERVRKSEVKALELEYQRHRTNQTILCGFCSLHKRTEEKSFGGVNLFKQHLIAEHGAEQNPLAHVYRNIPSLDIETPSAEDESLGDCSICNVAFANAQDLYDHIDECVLLNASQPRHLGVGLNKPSALQTKIDAERGPVLAHDKVQSASAPTDDSRADLEQATPSVLHETPSLDPALLAGVLDAVMERGEALDGLGMRSGASNTSAIAEFKAFAAANRMSASEELDAGTGDNDRGREEIEEQDDDEDEGDEEEESEEKAEGNDDIDGDDDDEDDEGGATDRVASASGQGALSQEELSELFNQPDSIRDMEIDADATPMLMHRGPVMSNVSAPAGPSDQGPVTNTGAPKDTRNDRNRSNDTLGDSATSPPWRTGRKRTKTGCLTCRKRRIKCDEERPVCTNCVRSKRHCEGYSQRVVFKPPLSEYRSEPQGGAQITFQDTSVFRPAPDRVPDSSSALVSLVPRQERLSFALGLLGKEESDEDERGGGNRESAGVDLAAAAGGFEYEQIY